MCDERREWVSKARRRVQKTHLQSRISVPSLILKFWVLVLFRLFQSGGDEKEGETERYSERKRDRDIYRENGKKRERKERGGNKGKREIKRNRSSERK